MHVVISRGSQEVPGPAFDATGAPDAEKIGWRLGTQAYTFNSLTFFDAVDKTAALGLKYIEAYPGQKISSSIDEKFGPDVKSETAEAIKAKLKEKGVKLVNFGVTGIPNKEEDARKLFDWAKSMGIETIVTESTPEFLDKLCNEYGISAALHNHPNSWPPEKVLKACEGKSNRIGSCADTGHWMRRDIKPLEGIQMLKGRIVCLHLKDLNEFKGHDVPWGTGKGDLKAVLAELHKQGFKGVFSIEYETKYSMADLAACVKFLNDTAKELAAEK
jgi:sugar phosphate isomerase/epimerase